MKSAKRWLICLLVLALVVVITPDHARAATILGYGTSDDGLSWLLDSDGILTISGTGPMTNYSYGSTPWYDQNSSIKKIVIESGVTYIGSNAFYGCTYVAGVTIPNTVISIGYNAFSGCHSLTSVSVPGSVATIGNGAFSYINGLKTVIMGSGVKSIGNSAFECDPKLTTVTLPGTLESIDNEAFYNCPKLTDITLPSGLKTIGTYAFYKSGLQYIEIPGSVTSISDNAFGECADLMQVVLNNGTEAIGTKAFYNCYLNNYLTIPGTVASIGANAFGSTELKELYLCDGVATIGDEAFSGNSLTTLTIPASVTSIGLNAFKNTTMTEFLVDANNPNYSADASGILYNKDKTVLLEAVATLTGHFTVPGTVHTISKSAFREKDLTGVTIPNSVKTIGDYAFASTDLTEVTVPDSVTSLGSYAFMHCRSLTEATLGTGITTVPSDCFYGCKTLSSVTLSGLVTEIGEKAFDDTNLTSFTIPDSVTSMGSGAFSSSRLTSVVVGKGITLLPDNAFSACTQLTSVTLPDTLISIGRHAFYSCGYLTSITIPDSVQFIGSSAFQYSSLKRVTIPASVTSLANYSLSASGLTEIYFEGDPPKTIDNYAFSSLTATAYYPVSNPNWTTAYQQKYGGKQITWKSYVPAIAEGKCGDNLTWKLTEDYVLTISGTGDMYDYTYSAPAPWNAWDEQIVSVVVESGATGIGDYAFYCFANATSVTIADTVTSIGKSAFCGWYALTEAALPEGLTELGDNVFQSCKNLTGITVPDGVTSIGNMAFYGCLALADATIGQSVESIGYSAFTNCVALTELTIPSGVNIIGSQALKGCSGLAEITFLGDRPTIAGDAFSGITVTAYYPDLNDTWDQKVGTGAKSITWVKYAVVRASGICGDLTWVLMSDGVMTFSGSGAMTSYKDSDNVPWYDYRDYITEIVIESGATNIGSNTFSSCGNLTDVTIPETVTYIGGYAFDACSALTEITIPEGITSIGEEAFGSCTGLKSVTIPGSLNVMGDYAFYYCTGLTSVTIQEGATWIGCWAFYDCKNLRTVTIPDSVTYIGDSAFYNCTNLSEVTIPAGVENIGSSVFHDCSGLTELTVPGSVTFIGNGAFLGCTGLRKVTIEDGVEVIFTNAFNGCSGITELTLGNTVTYIEGSAFYGCTQLSSVTIPSSVIQIGDYAFSYCHGLATLTFEGDMPVIGDNAFVLVNADAYYPCDNDTWPEDIWQQEFGATTLTWHKNHTPGETVTENVVAGSCTVDGSYDNVSYCISCAERVSRETVITDPAPGHTEEAVPGYGATCSAPGLTDGSKCSVCGEILAAQEEIPADEHTYVDGFCTGCGAIQVIASGECGAEGDNLTWVLTVDGVVTISGTGDMKNYYTSDYPWKNYCTQVLEVVIEEGATSIGNNAFYFLNNMKTITIPEGVTSIGASAFRECWALTQVNIPQSVTTFGREAFRLCKGLESINIPDGVTSIGEQAFYGCAALKSITIPKSVTTLGPQAFCECSGLTDLIISEGVTGAGSYVFGSCTSLTSVTIPGSLVTIGSNMFTDCYSLTSVTILEGVTTIGDRAFYGCSSLTGITLPDSLVTIGSNTFYYCIGLDELRIPANVTSVGASAFRNCNNLTSMVFCGDAPVIGENAFYSMNATVSYPCGNETWTEDVMQQYNGTITWTRQEHVSGETVVENEVPGTCTVGSTHEEVVYCTSCGGEISREKVTATAPGHDYADGACTVCGEAEEITYDMSVAGANMSLGNELAVNFFVKKVDIDTTKDYYIRVTKTYADGRADVTKTYYFQKGEWMDYNSTYYGVKFNGVAAKEMADKLYVQVFHADGTPASDVWTDSIRDYAMRMFGKGTDEKKTMYVDMLNYGAAAQTEFSYGTDDLANSKLTAEHQAYATQTIAYANNRVEGENYYGTNLNLGSSIALNMYFQNVSQDMYAIATYTDHYGNEKEVRIEGSAFVLNKASTNGYRISINTLAVADVRQLVTCTVYDTDGTVVGTCTDSVEGYIARKANSSALYDAIMRFATSAYNSFH